MKEKTEKKDVHWVMKRPYAKPTLTNHGDVNEITEVLRLAGTKGMGTYVAEPMIPKEKEKKVEEEREEAKEHEKKPYSTPELRRFGMAEELTESDAAPSGFDG
jgi:hypothetical protein